MTTQIQIKVCCDTCHATMPTLRTTSRGARSDAERIGWRVSKHGPKQADYCPTCRMDDNRAELGGALL